MSREKDSRDFHRQRGSEAAARSFAETLSAALPGEQRVTVKGINPITGTAASVHAEAAPESDASLIQTALDYVQGGAGPAMGFTAGTEPSAFVPDPHVQRTRGGAMIVLAACRRAAWNAFARFGMGTLASSSAASLVDVFGDSTLPADL